MSEINGKEILPNHSLFRHGSERTKLLLLKRVNTAVLEILEQPYNSIHRFGAWRDYISFSFQPFIDAIHAT